ncbi:DUF6282 family protein [Lyngbya aestuarii]|uniref:DUF6282 family protein n=1 Tax=Lyngbya aestuarii TaxID=118322 RepID=UPI00403DF9EC
MSFSKICIRKLVLLVSVFCLTFFPYTNPLLALSNYSNSREIIQPPAKNLIEGAIEFHVHSAPDVTSRSLDDFELAERANQAGMRAIVLKNHVTNTADRAVLVHKIVPDIEVFGGVVLNRAVGGINLQAVEAMYGLGKGYGKVVWLPTIDADYHLKVFHKPGTGIKVAPAGKILPEMDAVLQFIAQKNLILETGHISPEEVILVIQRAKELGVKKIVVTHAMADVPGLSLESMQECAALGAFLELVFVNNLMGKDSVIAAHRNWHRVSIKQMVEAIRAIGAEHFILSTDLGRQFDPLPADGYQLFVEELIKQGISQQEIDLMSKDNPAQLLGLDSIQ